MINPAKQELSEGIRLHLEGNLPEALACYSRALNCSPDNPEILLPIGAVLHDLDRYDEALAVYQRIMDLLPASAALYHNRGNTLLALDRFEEAIDSYARALALMPEDAEALVTMGTAFEQLGRYDAAMKCYEEALKRVPACAEAHWNLALALLRRGEYLRGWEEFGWRWQKKGYPTRWREFPAQMWDGRPLHGRTILIHAEQAFGDTIQFARYLPLVALRGGTVIVECPQPLAPLLETIQGVTQVVTAGTPLPHADFHLPLMSLPQLFATTPETIPDQTPYLFPPQERLHRWQARIGSDQRPRIGFVWAGRKSPDPHRSCRLSDLVPLANSANASIYSLQVGEGADQAANPPAGMDLIDLTGNISDFADTAALIAQLDLVISIDTAVAHLAAAMGKRTFILLPFAPDWRWMLGRNDSPWYPTVRLFRQTEPGDWQGVIGRVMEELKNVPAKGKIDGVETLES
ncbi:tetratricopeptide repeat protein [Geobacter argillaceus]|uniref:Glycosyl transferase family 9 (Putative heptosyltransferase) n=1 Tax=Geobacter argillaceus TaxID=345631 RepID=A0A562VLW2_9BACT|nr:tetratricopeptide repeat-containing glycosyltransferase family protein [Geobacter argillaceus]TWJ18878.1 glycosyl transferase family 9 (putative heptosyltransferase) [Geobacter argillaceus]